MAKKKTTTSRATRKTAKKSAAKTVKKKSTRAAKKSTTGSAKAKRTVKKKASAARVKKVAKKTVKRAAAKRPVNAKSKRKKTATGKKAAGGTVKKGAKASGSAAGTTKKTAALKSVKKSVKKPATPKRPARRVRAVVIEEKEVPLPTVEQLRKVKTGLTKRDLGQFRQQLLSKRSEILGDVASLQHDARNEDGDLSHVPVHMADVGSDNYEQEFTLGLVESERKLLFEIDQALMRIQEKTYGVCLARAIPIGRARLDAKPWAKYCIEEARDRERRMPR